MRFGVWLVALLVVSLVSTTGLAEAAKETSGYQTSFKAWNGSQGEFAPWGRSGVTLGAGGALTFDPATASAGTDPYAPGGYFGRNYYNGGSFSVGEATSPVTPSAFAFSEAIVSWNADTPDGTWVELQLRAHLASGRATKWYSLGVWASGTSTVARHSISGQGDADGFVAIDTVVLTNRKEQATGYEVKARVFSANGAAASIRNVSVAASMAAPKSATLVPGDPAKWNTLLAVPECSQMVYPDGGEVWCSPTSVSMVLGSFGVDPGPCEPRVRAAVEGVFDWKYDGHGNWPFNTAYAATRGMDAYVARFTTFRQVEDWIAAGVPVVISFGWGKGDLAGAAIPSSNGHLSVIVGFDAAGNPVMNDSAAATDAAVQRTYDRAELETVWLEHSGGTVYLIYPTGKAVPPLE